MTSNLFKTIQYFLRPVPVICIPMKTTIRVENTDSNTLFIKCKNERERQREFGKHSFHYVLWIYSAWLIPRQHFSKKQFTGQVIVFYLHSGPTVSLLPRVIAVLCPVVSSLVLCKIYKHNPLVSYGQTNYAIYTALYGFNFIICFHRSNQRILKRLTGHMFICL